MNENNPFKILDSDKPSPETMSGNTGRVYQGEDSGKSTGERIQEMIKSSPIFLFMKGTPDFPQCGFSANTVGILNTMGAKFLSFDVLSDMDIRQGIKDFSNWPTIPQLYIDGEFVGGNDIVTELYQTGELQKLIGV